MYRMTLQMFRLLLGAVLLASALGKSLDMPGFVDVLVTYQAIPVPLLWPAAILGKV